MELTDAHRFNRFDVFKRMYTKCYIIKYFLTTLNHNNKMLERRFSSPPVFMSKKKCLLSIFIFYNFLNIRLNTYIYAIIL